MTPEVPENDGNEDGEPAEPGPRRGDPDTASQVTTKPVTASREWHRHPIAVTVIAGIAIAVILGVGALLAGPAKSLAGGVVDFFRGPDAGQSQSEQMHDFIDSRPYWDGHPHFFDSSMAAVWGGGDSPSVITVDGTGQPSYAFASTIGANAYDFAGDPILLVGRVSESAQVDSGFLDPVEAEVKLLGPEGTAYAYVGLPFGATLKDHAAGDLMLVRGYVIAVGRTDDTKGLAETAYFAATDAFDTTYASPAYKRALNAFVKAEQGA